MRTREKQRIFKRFKAGESVASLANRYIPQRSGYTFEHDCLEVEQAIRDCMNGQRPAANELKAFADRNIKKWRGK